MRIKEGQLLELKNGQTIGAEEEIERFAMVLLSACLRCCLLCPQQSEELRALIEAEGESVIRQIAQDLYKSAVILDEFLYRIWNWTDLSEDEKEAYSEKAKEDKHE